MASSSRSADYWSLTKPEVNLLIGLTTAAGFCLARPQSLDAFPFIRLGNTIVGTLLVASGTGTLNQFIERRFDALMRGTARRPVAAGRIQPSHALAFGLVLSAAGAIYLGAAVNALSSLLAVVTMLSYLLVYTPLKRRTPLCTVIGALRGAAPPLIGWAASSGSLSLEAGVLYALVFLWQFPHFMAIAWMYREDYYRAGYMVLPRGESSASFMACQATAPLLVLVPLRVIPVLVGRAGLGYLATALVLGGMFIYRADQLVAHRTNAMARRLLFASIAYLPLLFTAMVVDRV